MKTEAEIKAIKEKYKDPAYMRKAIEGVADKLANFLFPSDNEPKIVKPQGTMRKRPDD